MRSWSSLLSRVEMTGKVPGDDAQIDAFFDEVVAPGHHVVSYNPHSETVVVLSADAAHHLREAIAEHGCEMCRRIDAQLQVQEGRHDPQTFLPEV